MRAVNLAAVGRELELDEEETGMESDLRTGRAVVEGVLQRRAVSWLG